MQQAKIENSERDESRVDAKKCVCGRWGGGGGLGGVGMFLVYTDF